MAVVTLPASYSIAYTRVPLPTTIGAYRLTRRKGERKGVTGTVMLNIVNGRLSSVTVYRPRGQKAVNIPAHRLGGIFTTGASAQDIHTFDAFTR